MARNEIRRFLRLKAVQDALGCGRSTVYKLISEGKLPPPAKIGRVSVWPEDDIAAFQAESLREAGREGAL